MAPTIMQAMGLPQQAQFVAEPIKTFSASSNIAHPLPKENKQEQHELGSLIDEIEI